MVDRLKKTDSVALVEEMEGARRATGISSTSVAADPPPEPTRRYWRRGTGAGSPPSTSYVFWNKLMGVPSPASSAPCYGLKDCTPRT